MKKMLMLSLVFVLLMVSTVPALAKAVTPTICGVPTKQVKQRYALAGRITALNSTTQTVTVLVAVGNRLAKPCVGLNVILDASDSILKYSGGARITFDKLKVGQSISSNGYLVSLNFWDSNRISVGATLLNK